MIKLVYTIQGYAKEQHNSVDNLPCAKLQRLLYLVDFIAGVNEKY
jgi:hypothetical protein